MFVAALMLLCLAAGSYHGAMRWYIGVCVPGFSSGTSERIVGQVREYFDVPLYKGECSSLF